MNGNPTTRMRIRSACRGGLLALASLVLCSGGTCRVDFNDDGGFATTTLDGVVADIRITSDADGASASVEAVLTDRFGQPYDIREGQSLAINGRSLGATSQAGVYTRSVSSAAEYRVTVNEPTRGVQTTTFAAPAAFEISVPESRGDASLAGFTLEWSEPDAELDVDVTLTQTIFGEQRDEQFGPVTDTGSFSFDSGDLRRFRQGANLLITLTKTSRGASIDGLRSGTIEIAVSTDRIVTPAP